MKEFLLSIWNAPKGNIESFLNGLGIAIALGALIGIVIGVILIWKIMKS